MRAARVALHTLVELCNGLIHRRRGMKPITLKAILNIRRERRSLAITQCARVMLFQWALVTWNVRKIYA